MALAPAPPGAALPALELRLTALPRARSCPHIKLHFSSRAGSAAPVSCLLGASLVVLGRRGRRRALRLPRRVVTVDVSEELRASLQERTLDALDFDFVLGKLRDQCCTAEAIALCDDPANLLAESAEEARDLYRGVLELATLEDTDLVLDEELDIAKPLSLCAQGAILDPEGLIKVSAAVESLMKLSMGLQGARVRGLQIPWLTQRADRIELPDELLDLFLEAFDEEGELNLTKFPELAEELAKKQKLEETCAELIIKVLASGKYRNYCKEDGYQQFGSHYVLSVRPKNAKQVGPILTESRSGNLVYCEPYELVEPSDELKQCKKMIEMTTRRIYARMSAAISKAHDSFKECLYAAAEIDLARARLFLGEDMEGEVPEIGDEGVLVARHARNPCLLLREGLNVKGYRLELGSPGPQGLVLSGPNAGGKTVTLKTIGLLALLARCGIPVPAGESPRIDFFGVVLADLGDMQTIEDDLSTYSAHLVASRIMLEAAEATGRRALLLVDEAGTGTDPMQGAALARAVLETMLETGARIVSTTHCMQLKNWALEDPRLMTAAMEYKNGLPTFRLVQGAAGESHAIETARRLQLPSATVRRAELLLTEDQRSLLMLQRKAEELENDLRDQLQRAKKREAEAVEAAQLAQAQTRAVEEAEERLRFQEQDLDARRERLQAQLEAKHKARAEAHEFKLQEILRQVRTRIDAGEGAGLKLVGDQLGNLSLERDQAAVAAAQAAQLAAKKKAAMPGVLTDADQVQVGDWVTVLKRGPNYGQKGPVQQILETINGPQISVSVGSRMTNFAKSDLGKAQRPAPFGAKKKKKVRTGPSRDYSKVKYADGW